MDDSFMIAAFRSRQQVLRLDAALRRVGVRTQVVSTPKAVAIGCGLSVRFDPADFPAVREVTRHESGANFIGFYNVYHIGPRTIVKPAGAGF